MDEYTGDEFEKVTDMDALVDPDHVAVGAMMFEQRPEAPNVLKEVEPSTAQLEERVASGMSVSV